MLHCPTCGRSFAADVKTCPEDGAALYADATIAVRAAVDPLAGRVLDEKYRLDARLGDGGMGTVYRATHLLIERPVAVKVLHPRFVEDEAAQKRFRREARAAGRLQHTNAVAVTDFGRTADGFVYIVMELLEGQSLRDLLAREAPLESRRAVAMMLQAAAAVEAAHESGIIHRDLKPGNIFIVQPRNAPPVVKVLDFGIAKLAADTVGEAETHALTQTGVMIGTPRYMSPEQCDGVPLTPASDVYSLGIILYEMLTGAPPFTGMSPLAVALQHSSKPPRRPTEVVADIPLELEKLILHALEKNPAQRPPDAGVFRRELYMAAKRAGLDASLSFIAHMPGESENGETVAGLTGFNSPVVRTRHNGGTTNETTVLADTTGKGIAQTGDLPVAAPTTPVAPAVAPTLASPSFTRLRVFFSRKHSPWLSPVSQRLRQPPMLLAATVTVAVLFVGLASLVRTRSTANVPGANANVAAPPEVTPTAEAAPVAEVSPSPVPDKSANPKRQASQPTSQPRRTTASRPVNRRQEKKNSKVGSAFKKLKKVLNPF